MTSIFTGFTPTKPACDPIANPKPPKNKPKVLGAKDEPAITTSVIGALPASGVGAPSSISAESKIGIVAPVNLGAESKASISTPTNKTAQTKASIAAPSSKAAQTAVTIPVPSEKTAQAKASVDTPSNLGAENAATISAPSSKTAQTKPVISAPSNVGAESSNAIPVPTSKTAAAKPDVAAPSAKTAENKQSINAPSAKAALAKEAIEKPSGLAARNYSTNLLTYSEQFDNAAWVKSGISVTANDATAPDLSVTSDTLVPTATNGIHKVVQTGAPVGINAFSIHAKPNGYKNLLIWFESSSAGVGVNLETLEVFRDQGNIRYSIKNLNDGSVRVSVTVDSASPESVAAYVYDNSATPQITFSGDGVSGISVWGAQLESSPIANDYIKTEASPITEPLSVDAPTAASALPSANIDTPSAATAESASVTPAPSTLTANPATAVTPPFPLNHARILYENVLQGYNSITDTGPTGTAINAIKPNTWERWKFSTAANTLIVDFSTAVDFDTVCIASHNLFSAGATIAVYYEPEPGGVFLELDTKTPTNNEPICFYSETLLDALTIEIRITGASGVPQIGYISAGESLQMQRPFFNGHIPITDGDVTEYYSNRTESGEIIGQQIRRQGYQTTADWRYIDDTWYRTYFDPFKEAAKLTPFFFMWNLLEYPDDVGFCRISQDINCPMQNGFTTKRTISMTLLGAG